MPISNTPKDTPRRTRGRKSGDHMVPSFPPGKKGKMRGQYPADNGGPPQVPARQTRPAHTSGDHMTPKMPARKPRVPKATRPTPRVESSNPLK